MKKNIFFLFALILLAKCGGNNPTPGATPNPKSFTVTGKYLEVNGVAKAASVDAVKAAVTYAVRDLED